MMPHQANVWRNIFVAIAALGVTMAIFTTTTITLAPHHLVCVA